MTGHDHVRIGLDSANRLTGHTEIDRVVIALFFSKELGRHDRVTRDDELSPHTDHAQSVQTVCVSRCGVEGDAVRELVLGRNKTRDRGRIFRRALTPFGQRIDCHQPFGVSKEAQTIAMITMVMGDIDAIDRLGQKTGGVE